MNQYILKKQKQVDLNQEPNQNVLWVGVSKTKYII